MTESSEARAKRPVGVGGWVAVLLCGVLAFVSASMATEVGFRIAFLVLGAILAIGGVVLAVRWSRRRSTGDSASR